MWESVTLRELKMFLVLAEELHFGRTADRLHLTPSRVSQMLRELETRLGGRLVERTSRRVALTPEGQSLAEGSRDVVDRLEGVLSAVQADLGAIAGVLTVGLVSPPSGGPSWVDIVRAFEQRHPACRVHAPDAGIADPLGALRRGEVDMLAARLPLDQPDLVIGPTLADESRVLAVARDHRLANRSSVSLEDLAGERVAQMPGLPAEMIEAIVPFATPSGAAIERHDDVPGTIAQLVSMVACGEIVHLSVSSLLTYVGHPGVVSIPVVDMPSSRTALVWRRSSGDARIRAFATTAADVMKHGFTRR